MEEKITLSREKLLELRMLFEARARRKSEHTLAVIELETAEAELKQFSDKLAAELTEHGRYTIGPIDPKTGTVTRMPNRTQTSPEETTES